MAHPNSLDLEGANPVFQRPWTALIPMITGTLSALGSVVVICELWDDFWQSMPRGLCFKNCNKAAATSTAVIPRRKGKMRAPIVRCLVTLSALDFVASIALALSTIPSPRDSKFIPFAVGNTQTCEAQGFVIQLTNVNNPLFSMLLTFYYLVTLRYEWNDATVQRTEVWAHTTIWVIGLACSVFLIPMDLYNSIYHTCWIGIYPQSCETPSFPDVPCERGGNAPLYMAIFTIFPLVPCVFALSLMMWLIYRKVRQVEARAAQVTWGETRITTILQDESRNRIQTATRSEMQEENETPGDTIDQFHNHAGDNGDAEEWEEESAVNRDENDQDDISVRIVGNPRNPSAVLLHTEHPRDDSNSSSSSSEMSAGNIAENQNIVVDRSRSRTVAYQALLFVLAFLVTHILRFVGILWYFVTREPLHPINNYFAFDVLLPLQGFWNSMALLVTRQELQSPIARFLKRLVCCSCSKNLFCGIEILLTGCSSKQTIVKNDTPPSPPSSALAELKRNVPNPKIKSSRRLPSLSIQLPTWMRSQVVSGSTVDSNESSDQRFLREMMGPNSIDLYSSLAPSSSDNVRQNAKNSKDSDLLDNHQDNGTNKNTGVLRPSTTQSNVSSCNTEEGEMMLGGVLGANSIDLYSRGKGKGVVKRSVDISSPDSDKKEEEVEDISKEMGL